MLVPFEVQLSFNHCSVHSGFRDGFDGVDASTAKSSEDLVQPTFGCFGFIRTQIGGDRHGDLLCKQRGFCPAASEALTPWQAEMCVPPHRNSIRKSAFGYKCVIKEH